MKKKYYDLTTGKQMSSQTITNQLIQEEIREDKSLPLNKYSVNFICN